MIFQKNKLFLLLFMSLSFLSAYVYASEANEPKLEIKAYSSEIKVGEPLILEIRVIYEKPNINSKTGEIITSRRIRSPYLIITKKGQKEEIKYEYDSILNKSLPIIDKGEKGLEYTGSFIVFYDQEKKSLLFNAAGEYSCRLESTRNKLESNTIEINVKPASKQEQRALSILTGEFDLFILGYPDSDVELTKIPGAFDRFKQVDEQCPDTMLAKMAAARVGIELYSEYEKQRTKARQEKRDIPKQIWKESAEYLKKGLELPDEFKLREDILFALTESEIEVGEKDYSKAIAYLEELSEKYPNGRWGKSALSGIEEVKTMMANDPNWANKLQAIEKE